MEQSAFWKVNSSSASQEILAFYGNWTLISVCTRARHLSLFWARSIQFTPSSLPISSYQFYIAYVVPNNLFKYKAFWTIRGMLFVRWWFVGCSPNAQAWGPHLVSCPRLPIQYTRSCCPYMVAVFSIRNLRMHPVVVTLSIYGGSLLHPQPEDAPCRGDKAPLITDKFVPVFDVRISKVVHDSYRPCWYGLC